MKKPRRRSKVDTLRPGSHAKKLRAEIAKHPNPMFGADDHHRSLGRATAM